MLDRYGVHAVVPAADMGRAQRWYEEKLGLVPVSDDPGGVTYRCADGTWFSLYPSRFAGTAQHTVAGWTVDDLENVVGKLRERGVEFEEYDLPDLTTVDGIAHLGPEKAAWFKDSEGNILGLIELYRPRT